MDDELIEISGIWQKKKKKRKKKRKKKKKKEKYKYFYCLQHFGWLCIRFAYVKYWFSNVSVRILYFLLPQSRTRNYWSLKAKEVSQFSGSESVHFSLGISQKRKGKHDLKVSGDFLSKNFSFQKQNKKDL